jgi:hypothetical protein
VTSWAHRGVTHLGMDVSKDSISVAVLEPHRDLAVLDDVFHDEESVRRPVSRFPRPDRLWACYEAGPTGYELHRLMTELGVRRCGRTFDGSQAPWRPHQIPQARPGPGRVPPGRSAGGDPGPHGVRRGGPGPVSDQARPGQAFHAFGARRLSRVAT